MKTLIKAAALATLFTLLTASTPVSQGPNPPYCPDGSKCSGGK